MKLRMFRLRSDNEQNNSCRPRRPIPADVIVESGRARESRALRRTDDRGRGCLVVPMPLDKCRRAGVKNIIRNFFFAAVVRDSHPDIFSNRFQPRRETIHHSNIPGPARKFGSSPSGRWLWLNRVLSGCLDQSIILRFSVTKLTHVALGLVNYMGGRVSKFSGQPVRAAISVTNRTNFFDRARPLIFFFSTLLACLANRSLRGFASLFLQTVGALTANSSTRRFGVTLGLSPHHLSPVG